MSTDPFDNVLRPVSGQYQEISQTTFVELVSVRKKLTRPAFRPNQPSVTNSVRRVAFGKVCAGTTSDPFMGRLTAVPNAPLPPALPYALRRSAVGPDEAAAQAAAKSSAALRSLLSNVDLSSIRLQAAPGNISGFVWNDLNGNGIWDDGEPALGGWYVYTDVDNSCTIALGEHAAITSYGSSWPATPAGSYTIQDVPADPVIIDNAYGHFEYFPPWHFRVIQAAAAPPGKKWIVTYPPSGFQLLNVVSGGTIPNVNFGVMLIDEGTDPATVQCAGICPIDLAVVLDDTGSMTGAINQVKQGIQGVIDILQEAVGLNIRLSLVTFKDAVTLRYAFEENCGAYVCGEAAVTGFQAALDPVVAGGGANIPEWSAAAVKFAVNGGSGGNGGVGIWRHSAVKVILVVTDAPNNAASNVTVNQAAEAALNAGIRIMYAATPTKDATMVDEGRAYADITNGIFVETDALGANLPELLTTFIYGLCASTIQARTCEGGTDHIINGTFDAGIAGWLEYTPPVSWSPEKQAMLIGVGGEARQIITGLNPGDRLVLSASIETLTPGGIFYGTTLNNNPLTIEAGKTVGITYTATVPDSGEIEIKFTSVAATNSSFYVDNVVACIYRIDNCGVGTVNRVQNPNFETGVGTWTDAADVALPETDPTVWDSIIQAIVVNVSNYTEVRTSVEVTPAQSYTLSFDIVSSQPDTMPEISLQYGVLSSSDEIIIQDEKSNAQLGTLPASLTLPFTGPIDGIVKLFFKTGNIGGVAKIKNVLVCDPAGLCEAGYTKLSYDDFTTGKGGWSGGYVENQSLKLNSGCGVDCINYISAGKSFVGLIPGSKFQTTVNLKSSNYGIITLVSGDRRDQLVIGPTPGRYTHESIVQATGAVTILLDISPASWTGGPIEVVFDDILVCVSAPVPCKNNVNNCRATIKWKGVPRRPFNIFNAVIRYTTRDQTTLATTEYTFLPTIEQHLGSTACDLWKQQGNGGIPKDDILQTGLSPATIGSIQANTYASVSAKANWLWSIPLNAYAISDQLTVYFPAPPAELLVEKVSIFFLEQYCQPSGGLTPPVFPPPLLCGTDPATQVEIGIMYTNNFGANKEFTITKHVNELWWQNTDFAALPLPWDYVSALGNGYKGPMARWDVFEFLLDSVDGRGLDQCTIPVDFVESSTQANLSINKFGMNGKAFFLDELVLPIVDPGPYEYPIPECDEVAICQSGPLLCRPGVDDGVNPPDTPCCDYNNVYAEANFADEWCFQWDLFDPYWPGCCGALTVRDLTVKKSLNPSDFHPYVVDWIRGVLVSTTYTQTIQIRQTIVLVENEVDTDSGRSYIMSQLGKRDPQADVLLNLG